MNTHISFASGSFLLHLLFCCGGCIRIIIFCVLYVRSFDLSSFFFVLEHSCIHIYIGKNLIYNISFYTHSTIMFYESEIYLFDMMINLFHTTTHVHIRSNIHTHAITNTFIAKRKNERNKHK